VFVLSLIDAGVTLSSDDALMSPPASTITCDKFRALLISIPYAVNVPDEVKVKTVIAPFVVTVGEPVVTPE
jgi:hypothetical protein